VTKDDNSQKSQKIPGCTITNLVLVVTITYTKRTKGSRATKRERNERMTTRLRFGFTKSRYGTKRLRAERRGLRKNLVSKETGGPSQRRG